MEAERRTNLSLPLVKDYEEVVTAEEHHEGSADEYRNPEKTDFSIVCPVPLPVQSYRAPATAWEAAAMSTKAVRANSPNSSPSKHITVVDVYDLAASIGKDFERLVDQYGKECINSIAPKVISALETLEALANKNERENAEILELRQNIERLEQEKRLKQKDRIKYEEELEQIEENYKKEIAELSEMCRTLSTENRSLANVVSSLPPTSPTDERLAVKEEEIRGLLELKEMSHRQKEEIRHLQKDVDTYACEVENLQNSIEKLIRQNEELLRKNGSLQKQGRMLVEEKCELQRRLEKTEEANIQLRKALNVTDQACKDLQQANQCDDEPRFTLAELREVLQEKNILKGRVMELEEELEHLRPVRRENKPEDDERPSSSATSEKPEGDEEELVYGPINREPEEKLYPWKYERKDSGVRKFFRFFKDLGGASPRRGSGAPSPVPPPTASSSGSPRPPIRNLLGQ